MKRNVLSSLKHSKVIPVLIIVYLLIGLLFSIMSLDVKFMLSWPKLFYIFIFWIIETGGKI